jgi:hypothetical protein
MQLIRIASGLLALACLSLPSVAQTVLFTDDFEQGTSQWALTGQWRLVDTTDPCAPVVAPCPSGTHVMRWGQSVSYCNFESGSLAGSLRMQSAVALPAAPAIDLSFSTNSDAEDWPAGEWDARRVLLSIDLGAHWTALPLVYNSPWYRHVYDLSAYAGQSVLVRFDFDAVDGYGNSTRGWFLDDIAITARGEPGVPFCFGDWCPCGNAGASGNGCATSFQPAGANLASSGTASVVADTVVLTGSGLSNSVVTFFQGTGSVFDAMYGASAFGDGRRCVTGSVIRLGAIQASSGIAVYPGLSDQPISLRGAIPALGGRRMYQVWYRNAATFCTASTFNLTNALSVNWQP